jgi:hypothetical protein
MVPECAYVLQQMHGDQWIQAQEGWETVADLAAEHLGLPTDEDDFYRHDLFNPNIAPWGCTPQRAAVAVRNVMKGLEPWAPAL